MSTFSSSPRGYRCPARPHSTRDKLALESHATARVPGDAPGPRWLPDGPSSQLAPAGTPPSAANRTARLLFCASFFPTSRSQLRLCEKMTENRRYILCDFRYRLATIATAVHSSITRTTFASVTMVTLLTVHNTAARCHQRRRYHSLFTTYAVTTYIYTLRL